MIERMVVILNTTDDNLSVDDVQHLTFKLCEKYYRVHEDFIMGDETRTIIMKRDQIDEIIRAIENGKSVTKKHVTGLKDKDEFLSTVDFYFAEDDLESFKGMSYDDVVGTLFSDYCSNVYNCGIISTDKNGNAVCIHNHDAVFDYHVVPEIRLRGLFPTKYRVFTSKSGNKRSWMKIDEIDFDAMRKDKIEIAHKQHREHYNHVTFEEYTNDIYYRFNDGHISTMGIIDNANMYELDGKEAE